MHAHIRQQLLAGWDRQSGWLTSLQHAMERWPPYWSVNLSCSVLFHSLPAMQLDLQQGCCLSFVGFGSCQRESAWCVLPQAGSAQNLAGGQRSPQTPGQRWPHASSSAQRSSQGSRSHGAPHGMLQPPCSPIYDPQ